MFPINELTSELIQKIIIEEEIPLRCRIFTLDAVNAVMRYGAVVGHSHRVS